jgi:hypothetical protein
MDMVVLAVELDQLTFEVGAHRARDLFRPLEVRVSEDFVPVLRHENQVRVKGESTVATSPDVLHVLHDPSAVR